MSLPTFERANELLGYDPYTGAFRWKVARPRRAAGSVAGYVNPRNYVAIQIDGRPYPAHRVAWLLSYGAAPNGGLDHVNGIGADNKLANLRLATGSQNRANTKRARNNTSGFKGVCFHKRSGKWVARITLNNRLNYLGSFDQPEVAHVAYCEAARRIFGEFARAA